MEKIVLKNPIFVLISTMHDIFTLIFVWFNYEVKTWGEEYPDLYR